MGTVKSSREKVNIFGGLVSANPTLDEQEVQGCRGSVGGVEKKSTEGIGKPSPVEEENVTVGYSFDLLLFILGLLYSDFTITVS